MFKNTVSFARYYLYSHVIDSRFLRAFFISKIWKHRFRRRLKKSGHKCLFVHVPKTGGTSINYLLPNNSIGHKTISELLKHGVFSEEEISKMYKFCVIRNPLERIVSYYNYAIKTDGSSHEKNYTWKKLNKITNRF